jgi:hypothetical protein
MSRDAPIPLEGKLDSFRGGFDFPELLLAVCGTGKVGCLVLETNESEKKIFLCRGRIEFAASSSPDDRLGSYLLWRNQISLSEMRRFSPMVRPGVRLGAVLIQHGVLAPKELQQAVLGQIRAIVLGSFRCPWASYRFEEGRQTMEETVATLVPAERWILDGIENVDSWRRVLSGVGSLDTRYGVVSGHEESIRSLDLDTGSLELLALLHHPKRVEEICAASELPDLVVCRRLWAFRLLGWARAHSEAAPDLDAPYAPLDTDIESLGLIFKDDSRRDQQGAEKLIDPARAERARPEGPTK